MAPLFSDIGRDLASPDVAPSNTRSSFFLNKRGYRHRFPAPFRLIIQLFCHLIELRPGTANRIFVGATNADKTNRTLGNAECGTLSYAGQHVVCVVAQNAFTDQSSHTFCTLAPLLFEDGSRIQPDSFPANDLIWWMITGSDSEFVVPGRPLAVQVEPSRMVGQDDKDYQAKIGGRQKSTITDLLRSSTFPTMRPRAPMASYLASSYFPIRRPGTSTSSGWSICMDHSAQRWANLA